MKPRHLAAIAVALLSITGCSKEAAVEELPTAAGPEGGQSSWTLPGADEAVAAVTQKNYQGAIAALSKAKASVSTDETRMEYRMLRDYVAGELVPVMADDPAAKEAYRVLGMMETGR